MQRFAIFLSLSFALAACTSDGDPGPDTGSPAPDAAATNKTGDANSEAPDGPKTGSGQPLTIVADKRTGRFYASDNKNVAEIPEDQREVFLNPFEALDRGYFPNGDSDPMSRWK